MVPQLDPFGNVIANQMTGQHVYVAEGVTMRNPDFSPIFVDNRPVLLYPQMDRQTGSFPEKT